MPLLLLHLLLLLRLLLLLLLAAVIFPTMKTLAALAALASLAQAHMEMKDPPPLRSSYNRFTKGEPDYDMTSPLESSGKDFPCKGYHTLLGTEQAQPVAKWAPGQSYSMTITDNAPHSGGSCQASVSFDGGRSWKVLHLYIGHCPVMGDSSYRFTLPSDMPAGDMFFAWSWFNNVGNHEMYMNCAAVTVKPAGGGNGCGTTEGRDLMFPQPDPEVDMNSKHTAPPTGRCAA